MRKQEFIDALYKCGWDSPCDAQHENISELWGKLFPTCKELEHELDDALNHIEKLHKRMEDL